MKEQKIDVLLIQSNNQFLVGYVKWFTDIPAVNAHPTNVGFPREDEMPTVNVGPKIDTSSSRTDLSTKD
jgi:hypothetical protein